VYSRHAVHRTIVAVDVEGFGDPERSDRDRLAVRAGLYAALERAFGRTGIDWGGCHHEDRGDGVLILAAPREPKSLFVNPLPIELAVALREYNSDQPPGRRIRLRMVLHAGEINYDENGVAATSVNVAFRLLEARALKSALRESYGVLALIVSSWFFDEVVRHNTDDYASYRPVRVTVKETTAIGWIHLPDAPYSPQTPGMLRPDDVPRQLPTGPAHFTGRAAEVAALTNAVATWASSPLVRVITGMGGIGKTALASHWLNGVSLRFPDGALYLDLHAFAPGGPIQLADALDQLLRGLGVEADRIPVKISEQSAMFRSMTSGRSLVLFLDDAESTDQVRQLLPGAGRNLVVVTSRHRLAGLAAVGARFVPLEPLDRGTGVRLLAASIGIERVRAERQHAETLIDLCAGLPLAICVVSARLILRPQWTLSHLASTMTDLRTRLARLSVPNDISPQVVLTMSYRALSADAARLYRLLGVHPCADFDIGVAAAVLDVTVDGVAGIVEELLDGSLLEEVAQDRFRFPGLMHPHARALADAVETAQERDIAGRRVTEWYLRSAYAADQLLRPGRRKLPYSFLAVRSETKVFAEHRAALAWLEAEQGNLIAVARQSIEDGTHELAWNICDAMWALRYRTHHTNVVAVCELGIRAANGWHNLFAEARMTFRLGLVHMDIGDTGPAEEHMRMALAQRESMNDERGTVNVREGLGLLALTTGRPAEAVDTLARVLDQNQAQGNARRIGRAQLNLGRALLASGDVGGAIARFEEARQSFAQLPDDDRYNDARLGTLLGRAYRIDQRLDLAEDQVQLGMSTMRTLGGVFGEAEAHEELGHIARLMGDLDTARVVYSQAAEAYKNLGMPDAARLRVHWEE
jgi:tetratricopeptide (TPR) repeat protein